MMIMVVLFIFGTAIITYSEGDCLKARKFEKEMSTFYLAMSGIEYTKANYNSFKDFMKENEYFEVPVSVSEYEDPATKLYTKETIKLKLKKIKTGDNPNDPYTVIVISEGTKSLKIDNKEASTTNTVYGELDIQPGNPDPLDNIKRIYWCPVRT